MCLYSSLKKFRDKKTLIGGGGGGGGDFDQYTRSDFSFDFAKSAKSICIYKIS